MPGWRRPPSHQKSIAQNNTPPDTLRRRPDAARAYEAHKRALAPGFTSQRAFSDAKTAFIAAVLHEAARGRPASRG